MEHAVSFDAVRPWRTAAIVASAVALLELLLIAAGAAAMFSHPLRHQAPGHSAARKPTAEALAGTPKHALLSRTHTTVLVLNGNGAQGAAAAEAARLTTRGYPIRAVGNAPRPSAGPTIIMFRPGYRAEAQRLATDERIHRVGALDGLRARELHGARLVILLGQ